MGRIVASINLSVDGVFGDPDGGELEAGGGWFTRIPADDLAAWQQAAEAEMAGAGALLLGRRSFEFFRARWAPRTGSFADRFDAVAKYVVSSTLGEPDWVNTTVLGGDPAAAVERLTREVSGDVLVYASGELLGTLLRDGRIDELKLTLFPGVAGAGRRLVDDVSVAGLVLRDVERIGESIVSLRYAVPGGAARDLAISAVAAQPSS